MLHFNFRFRVAVHPSSLILHPSRWNPTSPPSLSKPAPLIPALATRPDFEAFKARYVGTPRDSFTGTMKIMGTLPPADKPAAGRLINQYKQGIRKAFRRDSEARLDAAAMTPPGLAPWWIRTLPAPDSAPGFLHPLTQTRREVCALFPA